MPETLTASPPPAAPAAAPTTTPAERQAPPPTPSERPASEWLSDIGSELGDLDAGTTSPLKERDEKGKFKPAVKPQEKPIEKPEEPVDEKPEEPEKPIEKPTESPKPVKAAELRAAYDGLKKKVKDELEPEVQRLRAKVQEYETKPPEDTAPIIQKIKILEERNAQLEKHMALVDYEQSQDFSTKYDQPYRDTWNKATQAFNQLTVREPAGEDEMGQPKFNRRAANESDLIELGALPLSQLDERAAAMFGASAPRAIQYIERLRDLATAKHNALEEAKTKAGEWKSQRILEFQNHQKTLKTTWDDINNGLKEKFPKAYEPEQGNTEDIASHTKGFALADLLFLGGPSLTPEQVEALPPSFRDSVKANKPLSEVDKVKLHALARLKIANHDRLLTRTKKLQARVAELEKNLAEYEKSEPVTTRAGTARTTSTKPWDELVADELKAMDK
jgi:hypothetical protein